MRSGGKVLVVYEPGRAGAAAIDLGRELAELEEATLTVVGVAPQAPSGSRCGNSAVEYNEMVVESVARDLDRAGTRLGPAVAARTRFQLLIEGAEPSLQQFARAGGFELVLLPARRRPMRARSHPEAARLRLIAGAEIRVVGPASKERRRQSPQPAGGAG